MDAVDQIYAGLIDDARSINGSADRNANVGLVGRFDYDYLSKYLVQASFNMMVLPNFIIRNGAFSLLYL